ncbi:MULTISPECIES: lysoplasmalogenase [unclassified Corallococcus]|uniref:lysoplasmalogenase n=1 Tax=unclassified Corallococcus TaxID=2685029 RepID=UPI001A8F28B0|nr:MULTISPECIES: lysoplasmalogenase [unclassified Corallococcus]MBN9682274.1 lysoplasmalogenase [Corallococcus sp. NCSPR001]WAS86170.1 lysoplasmalogenase [Corallococcus sp. NCRR]
MRESWTGGTQLLAAVGLAGAVGFLFVMDVGPREARLVTKALPMVCLLLWLWPARGRYARLIFAGLALSLLGDVLLEVGPDLFLPGLGAFLLAHVGYAAAFLHVTRRLALVRALPFIFLAVGATVALWPGLGGMAPPVTAYVAVICAMGWRATVLMGDVALSRREQWLALMGALLFTASDGLLSIRLFVAPLPGLGCAVMLLYWAAQSCLAASTRVAHAPAAMPISSNSPT